MLDAPFVWFGGKRKVAPIVWQRFGDVKNLVEPFFGSGAVLLGRPQPFSGVETVNDVDGMVCLAPETRILGADLRWITADKVSVGSWLIGFDEHNGPSRGGGLRAPTRYRHWRITRVINVKRTTKPCYRLQFDDGTKVVASFDHLWLGGSHSTSGSRGWRWQRTDSLICNRTTQRSWLLKLCDVIEPEDTFEAGWLAGFYDGEGHLRNAPGWRVGATQCNGPELERLQQLLTARNFKIDTQVRKRNSPHHRPCSHVELNGGMRETLRFLMLIRPERLIRKFQRYIESMSLYGRQHQAVGLVQKEFLGEREVVAIETDSHTFVAEGLASHNCNFWRAIRYAPEETARYADWPVVENDLHARHAWLLGQRDTLPARLEGDPDWYDAKIAGYWCWSICCWIGSGFCSGQGPWHVIDGKLVNTKQTDGSGTWKQLPVLRGEGQGINRKRVHLGDNGQGINKAGVERKRIQLEQGGGRGVARHTVDVYAWFAALSARLKRVRVCCGDWSRVCGPSVTYKHGLTAVFLDPPYGEEANRANNLYRCDSMTLARDVREWAIENGKREDMRIAICGYQGEYDMPSDWDYVAWNAGEGFGAQAKERSGNGKRERIWFSPACLSAQQMGLGF